MLDLYNTLDTINWPKDVCGPCSDNRAEVSVAGHLPENTEQPPWPVHWGLGIPANSNTLSLSKLEWPGMIFSRNFNSVALANAHKQCPLDLPCIYLRVKKRMEKKQQKGKDSSFPEIFLDNTDILKLLDLIPKVEK